MYCILVTGIPAAGKSTMAGYLSEKLSIPVISKDEIKELLFDEVGFQSREEKVKLGVAAMNIMYRMAERLMEKNMPFILENNFEFSSKEGLDNILKKYSCYPVTVTLTGDYRRIYERFVARDKSAGRHRGHVVNDCYPEKEPGRIVPPLPYEWYVDGIKKRGMDQFCADGPQIVVDTTEFARVNLDEVAAEIQKLVMRCS